MTLGPLMLGIEGLTLLGEEQERLQRPEVGGVLLFSRNYQTPRQLKALTAEIKGLRWPPLLIAVDQEGGPVQRFREGFTPLPSARQLASAHREAPALAVKAAESAGWIMAAELRAHGIDFSFAPVLDMDRGLSRVIGERAFGKDPQVIAEMALAWQRGARQAGMVCVAKHFPGHGGTAPDSHHETAIDGRAVADLIHADLLPFRRLMDNGLAAIMMSHVIYPSLDSQPAGFSAHWIHYLRRELGFQGAVFSDDLGMAAAEAAGGLPQRVEAALRAGCDMAVLGNAGRGADVVLDRHPSTPAEGALRRARLHARGQARDIRELQDQPAYKAAQALLAGL